MNYEMLIRKLKRRKLLLTISREVQNKPFEVWLVGGNVRDTFLGIPSKDYDIVITGDAKLFSRSLANKLNAHIFYLDKEKGEQRIVLKGQTTIDIKPIVDIEDDAAERDFTINAIAFNLNNLKTLYDPFNGIKDLNKKVLKPINNRIFKDDPLRLLRLFRLAAVLNLSVSNKALTLAKEFAAEIDSAASERIKSELFLLFGVEKSYKYLKMMDKTKLLKFLFPEVEKGKKIPQKKYRSKNLKEHSLVCYDIMEKIIDKKKYLVFPDSITHFEHFVKKHLAVLKLSALLHDIGKLWTMKKNTEGSVHFYMHERKGENRLKNYYQKRLSLSNKEVEILSVLILHHMRAHLLSRVKKITNHALYRFVKDGGNAIPGILLLSYADSISSCGGGAEVRKMEKTIKTIMNYYITAKKITTKKRLITGDDLIENFELVPGPNFKRILNTVEKAQIEGRIRNRREALLLVKKLFVS